MFGFGAWYYGFGAWGSRSLGLGFKSFEFKGVTLGIKVIGSCNLKGLVLGISGFEI